MEKRISFIDIRDEIIKSDSMNDSVRIEDRNEISNWNRIRSNETGSELEIFRKTLQNIDLIFPKK